MPNVIAIFPGKERTPGGCEIYRTTMPYYHLQKKHPDWKADWVFGETLWTDIMTRGPIAAKQFADQYDIFVFPRNYVKDETGLDNYREITDLLHHLGKRLIYEVDDDLTNQERQVINGDAVSVAKLCDAITVTTKALGDLMKARTGKPAYVLPNMFAPETWLEPFAGTFRYADKITIGLTGSPTHERDWEVLKDVLPKVVQDNGVHLVLMGYHPEYLQDLPNTSYIPGLQYNRYAQVIQTCDIILAPLNHEVFNLSKSPIKVLEGQAARRFIDKRPAGAACIATDHPVYRLAIKPEKTGLLVEHTPSAWQEALDRMIYDERLRHQLQFNGHEWVQKHHDISKTATLWRNAYESILRKPIPA